MQENQQQGGALPAAAVAKTAVITRTKSRPLLLRRAIESVLTQVDDDFVHVIVNDGGDAAELEAVLAPYAARYAGRLMTLHNPNSLGMEAASNVGLNASTSRYVAIHDDDDSWDPRFLEKMTRQLEAPGQPASCAGVVCLATEVREQIAGDRVRRLSTRSLSHMVADLSLWKMLGGNVFPPISFLYRREVYQHIGGLYREDMRVQGDWEFNLRFLQKYDIARLDEHLAFYHERVPSKVDGPSAYTNSVQVAARHELYKTQLRNELLRRDLEHGRLGVGYLVNLTPVLMRSDRVATKMIEAWERVKRPFGR